MSPRSDGAKAPPDVAESKKYQTMRVLLIVSGVIEVGAGVALLAVPSIAAKLLLGESLEAPAAITVARIAGASLLALGVACGMASRDGRSRAAIGVVAAMLLYNTGAVVVLAYAGIGSGLIGIALRPAVALHAAMAIWCGVSVSAIWRIQFPRAICM
jgi:hypothetical protein